MRIGISLLVVALVCSSCGSDVPKTESEIQDTVVSTAANTEPVAVPEKTFPVLTVKNSAGFLKEYGKENPESLIVIKTNMGDIKVKLFEDTPLHRANFIMLIKRKYFENAIFYRVVKEFVVQGGDTDDEERLAMRTDIGAYYVPAEFKQKYYHRKGMVAMARNYTDNPDKKSSPYIFYIVHGKPASAEVLNAVEQDNGYQFSPEQRKVYGSTGGTPHLDGEHTVFGEVIEGLDIVDQIADVKVDNSGWPVNNVVMNIEILE